MLTNTLGKLNINPIMYLLLISMIITPFYTYHMAVSTKQQPPYPHATVTATAKHYPQNIVFRYFMLINSSFMALIFFMIFRWVEYQAKRIGFSTPPKYQFYIAEFSILCYCITIATIDGGGTGKLHGPCAVLFFIVWLVTIVHMTYLITKMRQWDTTVINLTSLRIKQVLAIYIAALWIWCIYHLATLGQNNKKGEKYVVIIQWNSVMINLMWVLSMGFEWKKFVICLSNNKASLQINPN